MASAPHAYEILRKKAGFQYSTESKKIQCNSAMKCDIRTMILRNAQNAVEK
jgi:hypothetical protein